MQQCGYRQYGYADTLLGLRAEGGEGRGHVCQVTLYPAKDTSKFFILHISSGACGSETPEPETSCTAPDR